MYSESQFKYVQTFSNHHVYCQSQVFKPFTFEPKKWSFLKLSFANNGLGAINFCNNLHQNSVKSNIPPYFKDQSVPIISYTYCNQDFSLQTRV